MSENWKAKLIVIFMFIDMFVGDADVLLDATLLQQHHNNSQSPNLQVSSSLRVIYEHTLDMN